MLAAIRPDDWNLPLFLHVLGAMLLVGGLLAGGTALAIGRSQVRLLRVGFFSLLALALPGLDPHAGGRRVDLRQGGLHRRGRPGLDRHRLHHRGRRRGALLLIALILGGVGVRRVGRGGGSGLVRAGAVLALVALVAYLVAVWAMGGKPD